MFNDRRNNGMLGVIDFIFDLLGQIFRLVIWLPITVVFRLILRFVKDVATGVYGKVVQLTVVVMFGAIIYFFQTHLK